MHITLVDTNPAGLHVIGLAAKAGHHVTFLQLGTPLYPPTVENLAVIGMAHEVIDEVDTTNADAVTDALAVLHERSPIDVVTTQHEMATEAVAIACRRLGLRGTAPEGVLTARRKDRCRQVLTAAGLANAEHALVETPEEAVAAAERIGFPVVLKPPSGGDSLLAHVAGDAVATHAAAQRILHDLSTVPESWRPQFQRGILVEEMLTGPLLSVELGIRGEDIVPFCVSGRFRWQHDETVELGSFIPSALTTEQEAECVAYAVDVCRAIGLDLGVFHVEIVLTARGPVLIEVNPRVMGGALPTIYRHATGQHIFDGLLRILTPGADVDPPAAFHGCTAGRKVMVRHDGVLAENATLDQLRNRPEILEVVDFENYHTGPGSPVRAGAVVARFLMRGPDHPTVVRVAENILTDLERDLGIELMIGDKDKG